MMKCQICGCDEPEWAYQPFGPDEQPHEHMTILGSHYRGFPVIKVCEFCRGVIQKGSPIEFTYKKQRYIASRDIVKPIPDYVSDALLWFEETVR